MTGTKTIYWAASLISHSCVNFFFLISDQKLLKTNFALIRLRWVGLLFSPRHLTSDTLLGQSSQNTGTCFQLQPWTMKELKKYVNS